MWLDFSSHRVYSKNTSMEIIVNRPAILFNNQGVVVVMNGRHYTAQKGSHPNYDRVVEAIKSEDWNDLPDLLDVKTSIAKFTDGLVEIRNEELFYNGDVMHNALSRRILQMFNEGLSIKHMTAFLQNLMLNPSRTAVEELYLFLEACDLPITEDGCFLAYKKVRSDYTDIYSGKFDNSVGSRPKMKRNEVDDNRNNTCSRGLHFCSLSYLQYFGSGSHSGDRVVIVKINPAHVVSIPSDYNNAKGRCEEYEVIGEYHDYRTNKEAFNRAVYTNADLKREYNYGDDDSEDYEDSFEGEFYDANDIDTWEDAVQAEIDAEVAAEEAALNDDEFIDEVKFFMDFNSEIVRAEVTRFSGDVEMYYDDDEVEELHHELREQAREGVKARVKVVNI